MAQAHKRPQEKKPSEVTIPRLSREEVERRTGSAFDAAVAQVIRSGFSRPPSSAEISRLRGLVSQRLRESSEGEVVDVPRIIRQFVADNPDSTIARYYNSTRGSTTWIFDEEQGRIRFSASDLGSSVTEVLSAYRPIIVSLCGRMADPHNRSSRQDMDELDDLMSGVPRQLRDVLHAQFSGRRNKLAIGIEYVDRTVTRGQGESARQVRERYFAFTNLQPHPDQDVSFRR